MNDQNKNRAFQMTLHKRLFVILLPAVAFILFQLAELWVKEKCAVIHCEAASWSRIQEIVVQYTRSRGAQYRLKDFAAYFAVDSAKPVDLDQLEARFVVDYLASERLETADGSTYPMRYIEFDDRNLWVVSHEVDLAIFTFLPPKENLKHFKLIVIGPRDAIRATWELADAALIQPIDGIVVRWNFDAQRISMESIWEITYRDVEKNTIRYNLDAQSGKIVNTE